MEGHRTAEKRWLEVPQEEYERVNPEGGSGWVAAAICECGQRAYALSMGAAKAVLYEQHQAPVAASEKATVRAEQKKFSGGNDLGRYKRPVDDGAPAPLHRMARPD